MKDSNDRLEDLLDVIIAEQRKDDEKLTIEELAEQLKEEVIP